MEVAPVQIGIDENGLGPRLGPMTVTAVRVEVDTAAVKTPRAFAALTAAAGIGDSKASCAHGAMHGAEGLVLALLRAHTEFAPRTFDELASWATLDSRESLRADCPDRGDAPLACWQDPIALPAFGPGPTREHVRAAETLREAGVHLRAVRVGVVCAKRMNLAKAAGQSRFDVDLALMVRLAAGLRGERTAPPVVALCGKVGGRSRYATALEKLSPLVGIVGETRDRSSYSVPGFGQIHFVLDGDASEPAIGLASIVGKYFRELYMHRINQYWIDAVPGLSPVSGYHEPNTERFVTATALARKERDVPDQCFER